MIDVPTKAIAGVTPGWHKLLVLDAATSEPIEGVREADAEAGTLTRTEIDANGNMVVKDGQFVTVTEQRQIRIVAREAHERTDAADPASGNVDGEEAA